MRSLSSLALLFSLALGLGACATQTTMENPPRAAEDVATTARVKAALFSDPGIKSADINVDTFKAKVQLSGFVASQDEIDRAIEVTRSVAGVASVKNDMRVK